MNSKTAETISKIIFYGTIAVCLVLTFYFWPSFITIILVWLLAVPVSLALAFISGVIAAMLRQHSETEENVDEEPENESKAYIIQQEQLMINKSEKILGHFDGAEIYEWIEIENPETKNTLRLWFNGTFRVDNAESFNPPEDIWWALIQPGILYSEDETRK